jgi:hypothetical protein
MMLVKRGSRVMLDIQLSRRFFLVYLSNRLVFSLLLGCNRNNLIGNRKFFFLRLCFILRSMGLIN